MSAEFFNVLEPFSKRRDVDVDNSQAIEEVHPEFAAFDQLFRVFINRTEDLAVQRNVVERAYSSDFFLLESPQQFALQGERHGIDLVKVDRSPVGCFQETCAVYRSGIGTFDGAEKNPFNEGFRDRCAVDVDVMLFFVVMKVVNCLGEKFLAGTCFTVDHDGGWRVCCHFRRSDSVDKSRSGADYAGKGEFCPFGENFIVFGT